MRTSARTRYSGYRFPAEIIGHAVWLYFRGGARTLGAMPVAAAVVGNDSLGAVLAARDMAAERHCAAALDGRHHLQLVEADVPGISASPRRPVVAEDLRNLQRWTGHRCRRLRRRRVFPARPG